MTEGLRKLVRFCPACKTERDINEINCAGSSPEGGRCNWSLFDEDISEPAGLVISLPLSVDAAPLTRRCPNGHLLEEGDQLCIVCGSATGVPNGFHETAALQALEETIIDGWRILRRASANDTNAPCEYFIVCRTGGPSEAWLSLYRSGQEPDPAVYELLGQMDLDHVPELYGSGRYEGRAYDVTEIVSNGSLAETGYIGANDATVFRRLADELGRALASFGELGLRHRDLQPQTILVRTREPLDLIVTGFGSARLSDFDLDSVAPLELSRYSAPEAIVGGVGPASDWWSLGMILLEQITAGTCFSGVNEKAFRIHVVTRGVEIPDTISNDVRVLLKGLLTRDPLQRWGVTQLRAWLQGETMSAPTEQAEAKLDSTGPAIILNNRRYIQPELFALAAAEADNWSAARDLLIRGGLATWLEDRRSSPQIVSQVRQLGSDEHLTDDFKLALVLMTLNKSLPLTFAGDIVTPAWLITHPDIGHSIVTGPVSSCLERTSRELWIVGLRQRSQAIRDRAKMLDIELDEASLRISILATSRANLEAEREALRKLYPDTDHGGLASILERSRLSEEDIIILLCASKHQFTPLPTLVDATLTLAQRVGIALNSSEISDQLVRSRRDIFSEINERIEGFARCGRQTIDEWADSFRVERRISLPRAFVLLATPAEEWEKPAGQQYIASILEHFEKRVSGSIARGPLVRFTIGKTTPRVDLISLGTGARPAEALLNHVLMRTDIQTALDPALYINDELLENRLRRLIVHAQTFRRDTGIDGRYLGFPFLLIRDERTTTTSARPRIAPVLLFPIVLDMEGGGAGAITKIGFDREREEIRLNPALEGILGAQEFRRWQTVREDLLARPIIKMSDVLDAFGSIVPIRSRNLSTIPGKDIKLSPGTRELSASAAIFNAEFTGQAIAEDLRYMRGIPPTGTSLEVALRTPNAGEIIPVIPDQVSEEDRYTVIESDPSQDAAVFQSRNSPGILVEGPPGTGKSQTIVNIVANAIGRNESVIVICQKHPALRVVQKRLEAVGLGERSFLITDVNRDREQVITTLRDQIAVAISASSDVLHSLRRLRHDKSARIEILESTLDKHHTALHAVDEQFDLSYRGLLGELLKVESTKQHINAIALRSVLTGMNRAELSRAEEVCAPLARLWLDSGFENSSLKSLRLFPVDDAVAKSFAIALFEFASAEDERQKTLAAYNSTFEVNDPTLLREWFDKSLPILISIKPEIKEALANWLDTFRKDDNSHASGTFIIEQFESIKREIDNLNLNAHENDCYEFLASMDSSELQSSLHDLVIASTTKSFFARLSLSRWRSQRRAQAFLQKVSGSTADVRLITKLCDSIRLELALRPLRSQALDAKNLLPKSLLLNQSFAGAIHVVREEVSTLLTLLQNVGNAAALIFACPQKNEAELAARSSDASSFDVLSKNFKNAFSRHAARNASWSKLERLKVWFEESWTDKISECIAADKLTVSLVQIIARDLPTLQAYQRFRARAETLDAKHLQIFSQLRGCEQQLKVAGSARIEGVVRQTLEREALLHWKGRFESKFPELLLEREEIEQKIKSLSILDREMRDLNKQLLKAGIGANELGSQSAWDNITRLRGPRMRRLREILEEGIDLGLMRLRPIWLMNPEVASRLLPRKAGQFDLVIYDEASQMPVEYAVPTLFRARRMVIAGDEKQMPPSGFFSSKIDSEEDEDALSTGIEPDDITSDAERQAYEEVWNRREVKDCPDLLQLGRGVLPVTTLQIHYRSKYRELITYSNAAFYKNTLSIPARHPLPEIQRVKPIEVIRVDGIYAEQVNLSEAARVAELLASYWTLPLQDIPSIGVVTFNRKQADAVEDAIAKKCSEGSTFLQAYQREKDRCQDSEDMGFFVKNVENVQGDERDVIIFSTTFGRDSKGSFRRSFGVLGQGGGQRRLNVAVTRAREKIVLVTSMPINDVSDWLSNHRMLDRPRDYLQAYLDYAMKMDTGDIQTALTTTKRYSNVIAPRVNEYSEADGLAQSVNSFITEMGYRPVANDDGDAFGLDFAIPDPRTGLFGIGIECDAPRHILLSHARGREIWRPTVLRSTVPIVHRISSSDWYQRPEEERLRLRSAIDKALKG